MQMVYIFINAQSGKLWEIAQAASKIKGVKRADAVTGDFDVIIYAQLEETDQLNDLIRQLQSIDGVLRTRTSIIISTNTLTW